LETPITNLSAALAPPIGGPAAANKAKAAIPLKRLIVPPTGVIVAAETLQSLMSYVTPYLRSAAIRHCGLKSRPMQSCNQNSVRAAFAVSACCCRLQKLADIDPIRLRLLRGLPRIRRPASGSGRAGEPLRLGFTTYSGQWLSSAARMPQIAWRATASAKELVQHKQWAVGIRVSIARIALKGTASNDKDRACF
jgi:hypothetical protein